MRAAVPIGRRPHLSSRLGHPCFCLCLGLEQITRTTPLRRIILQFSQIRLTLLRTFIADLYILRHAALCLLSIRNTAFRQVVRANVDGAPIAREDADVMHTHFPGDVGYDFMVIF